MHENCHHPPYIVVSEAKLTPEQQAHYARMLTEDPTTVLIVDQREAGVELEVIECSWCENPEAVAARAQHFGTVELAVAEPVGMHLLQDVENYIDQAQQVLAQLTTGPRAQVPAPKGSDLLISMGTRLLERVRNEIADSLSEAALPPMDFKIGQRVTPEQMAAAGYERAHVPDGDVDEQLDQLGPDPEAQP